MRFSLKRQKTAARDAAENKNILVELFDSRHFNNLTFLALNGTSLNKFEGIDIADFSKS